MISRLMIDQIISLSTDRQYCCWWL